MSSIYMWVKLPQRAGTLRRRMQTPPGFRLKHQVVKHMITLENTFDWYNTESNLRRVFMYVSIALAS